MNKLWLATGNRHKVAELHALTGHLSLQIRSATDLPGPFQVIEDGDTFHANAEKKARALVALTGEWCLADDSGLEVDALNGLPGVWSARFAGPQATDAQNIDLLLSRLAGESNRQARFRCVLCLAGPGGIFFSEGVLGGHIAWSPAGQHGFGYDPLFIPDGYETSLAMLGPDIKDRISHRARALNALMPVLTRVI